MLAAPIPEDSLKGSGAGEQSFKISDQEVLMLLVFTNAEMLEDIA